MLLFGGNYHVVSRWPNAFALSTSLHVGFVAVALLIGYAAVEPSRPIVLQMVSLGRSEPPSNEPATSTPMLAVKLALLPLRPAPDPASRVETDETAEAPVPKPVERQPSRSTAARAPVSPTATTHRLPSPSASKHAGTMSLGDYRRLHPESATAPRATPSANPTPRINGDRIADDLRAGVTTRSGAVGADTGIETSDYIQRLEASLGAALERIPGFDEGLHAEVEYRILLDGQLTGARLLHRSSDDRFDAAIVETVDSFNAGPRPANVSELHRTEFTTRVR